MEQDRQRAFLDKILLAEEATQVAFLDAVNKQGIRRCETLLEKGANVNQLLKDKLVPFMICTLQFSSLLFVKPSAAAFGD